ncbi:vesicle transport v-snare protein vti1 [Lentinula raphanica]|uniref:Vesicle transport v-snare protein vti1 n=1 Tax=Lentinula raphanica TaxID=153919 RepID=A0AA38UDF8_9AGAR|nr:vesicle transport v-snare protein vti1 [Lentinula raphanica]KAJ3758507.1 vesicle transport v-snare protein vti1 [Lentinula raphanica]KAJ3776570.1 vesicle transport v-snare protein vti1 [Lentinula raphanica]KAJ3837867.1 vesicle transport v-snare protein vti1 [Lentinula raphanica]
MDTSPTALFDSYEQDFKQFIETIREKLEGNEDQDGEQRKASLRRVEMELDEADEMVSQMDIEIQGIPQSIRPQYYNRLKAAKADLSRYKKTFKDLSAELARSSLLTSSTPRPGYSSDDPYGSSSDRSRLLAGTALLEEGTKRLQDSHRLALETEEQGADILSNLRLQREQIENSRNTLEMANNSIARASKTLTGMIRRMYQQRFVTGAIIAILIFLIIIVVWSKLS